MNDDTSTDTNRDRIVFQMEVESAAEPISGLLRRGERELSFVGWVGLAGALERMLESSSASTDNMTGRDFPK